MLYPSVTYNEWVLVIREWLLKTTPTGLLLLAVVVGIGGALGATVFHAAIALGVSLFYGPGTGDFVEYLEGLPVWWRVGAPTLGGLLVGILLWVAKVKEAEGEGVPEVMEALAVERGKIRPIVAPVKILAAALTLSSGGSAGREGPVIHIGSAIGSGIAQLVGLAEKERSLLLACGAAAAIGGAFGAPFAGVVFTIEILRHRPSFLRTGLITVSAVIGDLLTRLFTGGEGLRFVIAAAPEFSWWPQGLIVLVVGVLAAGTALLFGLLLRAGEVAGSRLRFLHVWRPALGGFVVGLLGLMTPFIHEPAAYPLMVDLLALTSIPLGLLLAVFVIKMVATSITLASGGVGGIFAPSLLLGTILGSVVGGILVSLGLVSPELVVVCVVVGMAAVFAAAAHAPITAALITYEMTGESTLIIPLLLTCYIAVYVARLLYPKSIYQHADKH